MSRRIYSEEFRIEAAKQVIKNGYNSIMDSVQRLGIHPTSLSSWIKRLKFSETIEKR